MASFVYYLLTFSELLKRILDHKSLPPDFTEDELEVAEQSLTADQFHEAELILRGRAELFDPKRAAAFYKVNRYCFSSGMRTFGVKSTRLGRFFQTIQDASLRLEGVVITNRDCVDSLKLNDKPGVLHYCDPPYYEAEDKYRTTFTKEDHGRFCAAALTCSGYDMW